MKRFIMLPLMVAIVSLPLLTQFACIPAASRPTNQGNTPTTVSVSPILFKSDFNGGTSPAWSSSRAVSSPSSLTATVTAKSVGTIDAPGTRNATGGLLLKTGPIPSSGEWRAALVSGLLPIQTAETNVWKLTLSFMLSASDTSPVTVHIESFDSARRRTGGMKGTIYPAAPNFYQRYALDLATMQSDGKGRFVANAPFVQFTFEGGNAGKGAKGTYELRLDNVNYSLPAFYVSTDGKDTNDGRSEKTAFATPQKALDVAQPGDIVLLMAGTYNGNNSPVATFRRGGEPDAWIVLKSYPGHKATLTSTGWNIISIADGSKEKPSTIPSLCYLEVRGLHIRGEGDVVRKKYPEAMNKPDSRSNSNGIAIDGRFMKNLPHHIRLADNLVEYCPGQGLGALEADWITIENNISRNNCWTTIYATSGISLLGASNFDATENIYRMLIRNNVCYRNETFEIWEAVKKPSDGNGIILDVNKKTSDRPDSAFTGRTLVQSNLCYDNGGSGIHTVKADHVDIINNTVYLNSASTKLEYAQIFAYGSDDVHIMNNILVAPVANLAAGEKPEPVNSNRLSPNAVFSHNVYFGGNTPPILGEGDVIADPHFKKPSRNYRQADFHLNPDSPAIGKGVGQPFSPFLDLEGKPRHQPPTIGAYENK